MSKRKTKPKVTEKEEIAIGKELLFERIVNQLISRGVVERKVVNGVVYYRKTPNTCPQCGDKRDNNGCCRNRACSECCQSHEESELYGTWPDFFKVEPLPPVELDEDE